MASPCSVTLSIAAVSFPLVKPLPLRCSSIFVLCLMAFFFLPVLPVSLLSGGHLLVSPVLYPVLIIIYYLYNADVFLLVWP